MVPFRSSSIPIPLAVQGRPLAQTDRAHKEDEVSAQNNLLFFPNWKGFQSTGSLQQQSRCTSVYATLGSVSQADSVENIRDCSLFKFEQAWSDLTVAELNFRWAESALWAELSGVTLSEGATTHISGERKFSPLSSAHMLCSGHSREWWNQLRGELVKLSHCRDLMTSRACVHVYILLWFEPDTFAGPNIGKYREIVKGIFVNAE